MATNPNQNQNYEIPAEMRDFAEKSVEQARKAIDGFMSAAQKTVDTFEGSANTVQASATDATRKTFSYAEQNLSAAFDLAQRMVRAKDMQEAMQIQAEFVRTQFESMQTQMKEFGSLAQNAMKQPGSKK
ncbi:phasin [Microvirga guangxiensis]|uniref:Phasin n=1 Tax=Microvirga guangxiensis TaxID=549386 RepID=A0A1G5KV49_9HYPH|nr:phasin [Microvirga guangxiensis]